MNDAVTYLALQRARFTTLQAIASAQELDLREVMPFAGHLETQYFVGVWF
jgi:hypothetical protein